MTDQAAVGAGMNDTKTHATIMVVAKVGDLMAAARPALDQQSKRRMYKNCMTRERATA